MKNTSPRKLTRRGLTASIGSTVLSVTLIACTNTTPAADTQALTQTTQEPTAVVQTAFPGLEPPTGEPELDSITTARPTPGEVIHATGPFDQRFVIQNLTFDGSTVSGEVLITSDISELLELQVLAGFYDERGNLLGTDRFEHHAAESGHSHTGPSEPEHFAIAVPAEFSGQVASASVGVPVLVNE